jgi:adenylate cyclase, class 2
MTKNEQEIEVKFPVRNLAACARRLEAAGARLTVERVREINLRFDTADGSLTREHRVLRLRQDAGAVMTYKGAAAPGNEVSARQEIEFQVSDLGAAQRLLEALGYQVTVMYEKYRTTYTLAELTVVLDELPFGSFIEIEGPDAATIRAAAESVALDWEARSTASYLALFTALCETCGITAQNLSFAEFEGIQVGIDDLNLRYADGGAG